MSLRWRLPDACRTIELLSAVIGDNMDNFRAVVRQFGNGIFHFLHRRHANNR